MNELVHTAQEGGGVVLASFGSGNGANSGGRAGVRAQGRGGRNLTSPGQHRAAMAAGRRAATAGGRGSRARQQALREIAEAARGRRTGRMTNAEAARLHAMARSLRR